MRKQFDEWKPINVGKWLETIDSFAWTFDAPNNWSAET